MYVFGFRKIVVERKQSVSECQSMNDDFFFCPITILIYFSFFCDYANQINIFLIHFKVSRNECEFSNVRISYAFK